MSMNPGVDSREEEGEEKVIPKASAKKGEMSESELKAIVNAEIYNSMGFMGGQLSNERAEAMDYFLGQPYGNESEGRSQVVSRDVAETILWIMPSLLRIFTQSDKAVEFEPQGPKDEEQAAQETDYCNYLFYRKNDGFLILYSWFFDALLQKNGVVKVYCEDKEENTREEYEGLTQDEYDFLLNDPELEPVEHTERTEAMELAPGMYSEVPVHDVVFRRIRESYDIKVDVVPPEEFLISSKARSPDPKKAPFVCHRRRVPVSDLIEMGYDKDLVMSLPTDEEINTELEYVARHNLTDERTANRENVDKAMREVWVYEAELRVDVDGDGIAELRKVTMAGNEILENEEIDFIDFNAITPVILTHKFFGLSIADLIKDLQLIKSTIWRQTLDNLYLNNNAMMAFDVNKVNLDDLLVRRPGGNVRVDGAPGEALMPLMPNPLPAETFPMIEYIDQVKENRTGVGKQFQGLNADTLSEANIPAVQSLVTAAQQRVEMIARIFAETGVKSLFLDIHRLVRKYPNKPEVIKLRNKWVPIDPRDWRDRTNMTVSVGLGSASHDQQRLAINGILADQKTIIEGGGFGKIVTMQNVYNAVRKKAQISGFQDADNFFTDPSTMPDQPPKPDPQLAAVQMDVQARVQVEQQKRALEKLDLDYQHQRAVMQMQFDAADRARQFEIERIDQQIEVLKIEEKRQASNEKHAVQLHTHDVDSQLEALKMALEEKQQQRAEAMETYRSQLDALVNKHLGELSEMTKLMQTNMQSQTQIATKHMDHQHSEQMAAKQPEPDTPGDRAKRKKK